MRFLLILFALFASSALATESVRTIDWSDLMPEGGEEELDELYESYYAGVEDKLSNQESQSLFDAGKSGGYGGVAEGSPLDVMPQIGTFSVNKELDGKKVRLPGFVLPFEYSASGKITEFLLVPYFGACIHTPPPPPNQIVYVVAAEPIPLGEQWDPIWATGTLRAKSNMNDLGDAAYTLEITSWDDY